MMLVSIIVPTKKINDCIRKKLIPALKKQTFKDFELIIVPDDRDIPNQPILPSFVKIIPSGQMGPAKKRDLAAKKAKGNILAFLDSDAYPDKNWLKNAVCYFKKRAKGTPCQGTIQDRLNLRSWIGGIGKVKEPALPARLPDGQAGRLASETFKNIAAVCGPGITPSTDNLKQKVSGWVWQSWLGAGGAGTYRCQPEKKREVDDYPTFNLLIRKKDFQKVGGFDTQFHPGEDTKLCHDLVYKLKKRIIYDPKILVYHHRREIFLPHLTQIARFGLHRGHFCRLLPKTSFRLGYFIPLFFVLFLFLTPMIILGRTVIMNHSSIILNPFSLTLIGSSVILSRSSVILSGAKDPLQNYLTLVYLAVLGIYFLLLLITSINCYLKEKNLLLSLLLIPTIFLTHLIYGVFFIKGFLTKKLNS